MKIKGWKILAISGLVALGATIITTTSVIVHLSDKYITFGPYKIKTSDIIGVTSGGTGGIINNISIQLITKTSIGVDSHASYWDECCTKLQALGWLPGAIW